MIDADTAFAEARLVALKDRVKLDEMIAALDHAVATEYASIRVCYMVGWDSAFAGERFRRAIALEKAHDFLRDLIKPNEKEIGDILRRAADRERRRA